MAELRLFGEALLSATTLTDLALPDGTFTYQVAGVDTGGSEGELSSPVNATIGAAQAPTGLLATVSATGEATLSWTAADGATRTCDDLLEMAELWPGAPPA